MRAVHAGMARDVSRLRQPEIAGALRAAGNAEAGLDPCAYRTLKRSASRDHPSSPAADELGESTSADACAGTRRIALRRARAGRSALASAAVTVTG